MEKIALIIGVNGQDGAYLARFLLSKGYVVFGSSRDAQGSKLNNLARLGINTQVKMLSLVPDDFHGVLSAIHYSNPHEVYYLSAQSSVGLSFEQPLETIKSIVTGTLNVLEACRFLARKIRIYNACSSEIWGNTGSNPANESTPHSPLSPYAVAKSSAFMLVKNYREAYGLHACSGVLFNHESPLRAERFVTQKVISGVKSILAGSCQHLILGRLDIERDWGWADDYVRAMWLMTQQETPDDYVIATGKTNSLRYFAELAFKSAGLDYKDRLVSSPQLFRPNDIQSSRADPSKARRELGWEPKVQLPEIIHRMMSDIV